nr:reverse transcriptase domain-containing protein [Tanacetum cinerariifolium]
MAQNINFSGSDQIQTPQYPEIHLPSHEISKEFFQAEGELMKSIQTFLETFNCIPFEEKPQILFQAWEIFFAIQYYKPENPNELFQKLLEDLKELAEYKNSQSRNHPIFLNDDKDHSDQNKECFENSFDEIAVSNSNEEKEEPPQDSDIHQLIEECRTKVSEERKQSMEDTMLELVKICHQKELLCIHDNVKDVIERALNTKLLSINSNSQRLDKEEQEVKNIIEQPAECGNHIKSLQNFRVIRKSSISLKNTSQISSIHAVATILSTKEPDYSSSMGYENPNNTPKTESNEIIKSGVEELLPNLKEENVVHQEEEEVDLEDISQIQDVDLREKLLSITRLIANIESLNDNPTPDCVLNSSVSIPIFENSDNSLSDNFSPEFEIFCDHTKETRSGNTTHADNSLTKYDSFCFEIELDQERLIYVKKNDISDDSSNDPVLEEADLFLASDNSIPPGIENVTNDSEGDICFLEELLIDDSILSHESSDSNFEDNPSIPRPPPKPPDAKFDTGKEILVVMNKFKCLRDEFYDSFMFVKYTRTRSSYNLPVESSPNPATSNLKRCNRRRSKQPFILEESVVDTMTDQRTMAKLIHAPTEGYAEAIVVPPILTEQFELKHSLINMMTSDQFFGLEKDNPHDHIRCDANSSSSEIAKLTHAVNQQTSAVTTIMAAILKQFQATPPPASVKAVEEICVTCGGAHLYYQCLAAGGNTFLKLQDNIQGYVSAVAVNYNQAITTRSAIVLDGPSVPIPPPFINLEEDERVEETLTDQDLAEYTIKVPHPLVHKPKPPSQRNFVVHQMDPLYLNIPYPSKMHKQKQQEKDKRLSSRSYLRNLETLGFLISCGFSELKCKALADLGASINLMPLSVWKKLGLPELISTRITLELTNRAICTPARIARDVFVPVGKFTFPADFVIVDYESDPRVPLYLGKTFPTDNSCFNRQREYLLNHDPIKDMDSILKDSVDEDNLVKFNTEYVYNDPFDSKGKKIKESKLLIDELDLPGDFLPSSKYDSFLLEDFSKVDALPSTNNEDKLFNLGILNQENLFEVITRVASDKNVKKLAISHASLILEDFDPLLYELPFFKEVPGAETLNSFSFKNKEKVFKPRILTSKGVHSSFILKLSHRGYKIFKIIKILKSPMNIFLFSHGEDIRILDVPFPHFYPYE